MLLVLLCALSAIGLRRNLVVSGFSQSVSYVKPIPTHEKLFAVGEKVSPNPTFEHFFFLGWVGPWVGESVGFRNNIDMFLNPEFSISQTHIK